MKYLKLYESFDDSLYSEISYNEYEVTSQNVDISFSSREVNKLKSLFKGWNMETKSGGKFMEFSNTTVKRNIFLKRKITISLALIHKAEDEWFFINLIVDKQISKTIQK